jgi:hypothetical protein
MKTLPAMTAAVDSTPARNARPRARAPRPLPVWLQVGVVVLVLAQGVQTVFHWSHDHATQAAPLARFDYDPYGRTAENMQPTFQYAGYYAHAPGAMSVMPVRAYDATPGRWVERDPLPAK